MLKRYHRSPYRIPVRSIRYPVCYSKKAKKEGRKQGMLISFDYAIKFLLKNKEDFYVVEDFLSSLLELVGYPKIKIMAVKDPEHQKSVSNAKVTIPDLLVQDEEGKHYLIEIERGHFSSAAYKAHYNTSYSTVQDFLDKGDDFSEIKKIIHISILYQAYGNVDDYIYYGKTEPRGMNNNQKLAIQKNREGKRYNTLDDFPEYFFVFPDNFCERFKSKFDEWMNLFKNGEIREEALQKFKDLKNVEKRLDYLNLTDMEKREFDKIWADRVKHKSQIQDAKEKGEEIGIKQGKEIGIKQGKEIGLEEGAIKIARRMLKRDRPIQEIVEFTELSEETIEKLKRGNLSQRFPSTSPHSATSSF